MRVDSAGLGTMAGRWGASVSDLSDVGAPAELGLSVQASVVAVNSAQADIAVFAAALATQVDAHATLVTEAVNSYLANETRSATMLAVVAFPVTGV
ncbi:MAG: hypothetical protein K2X56_11120 [Mycobacterium pseudokansasii]|nr:hypothetical protein [Mycobacterium pseudokansasii]